MLSCYCFCSGKFQSPRTEHLCSSPLLSSLPSESSCLLPCILLLLLFTPLILQISPLIREVENIFGDPWLFPATFLPKYLTGCISHCCIVGDNHGIDVHVLITQSTEWYELQGKVQATSGSLSFSRSNSLCWFGFLAFVRRTQKIIIIRSWSCPMSPSPADMLSCCCFCSGKFQSPRTEHLSSPPLLSSLPSEPSCLLPCILLLLLLHTSTSSNLSSHHRGREHLW